MFNINQKTTPLLRKVAKLKEYMNSTRSTLESDIDSEESTINFMEGILIDLKIKNKYQRMTSHISF